MENQTNNFLFLRALNKENTEHPPIWLMRQAGRYLPEYRALREKAGSFWAMCMTPDYAAEVTLQPIRRFDFDAAIIFSDILVIPHALGQGVRFEDGIGPVLERFPGIANLEQGLDVWREKLSPVYQALRKTRAELSSEKALIGFAGAPWTLAAYMYEGRGSPDQRAAKLAGYRDPEDFKRLLAILVEAVSAHLIAQLESGADAVQMFDSWAGGLPERAFSDWVIEPNRAVVARIRRRFPHAKIIGFPRAATESGYFRYATETGVDAIGIDTATSMIWAAARLGGKIVLQGNLDPIALIAGGNTLDRAVDDILGAVAAKPFIFNLGHGILPETPLDHVARLIERVRGRS